MGMDSRTTGRMAGIVNPLAQQTQDPRLQSFQRILAAMNGQQGLGPQRKVSPKGNPWGDLGGRDIEPNRTEPADYSNILNALRSRWGMAGNRQTAKPGKGLISTT